MYMAVARQPEMVETADRDEVKYLGVWVDVMTSMGKGIC